MCAACSSVVEPGLGYSTVADTGDRFFSHPSLPSPVACDLSLQTLLVALTRALKPILPYYSLGLPFSTCISFVLLLLLAGVALCREPLSAHFLLHVRLPGLAPYLLARFHAVSCTFSPTHRIRSSWSPGFLYYILRNRRPRKRTSTLYKQSLRDSACHFLGWTSTLLKRRVKASPIPA